MQFVLEQPKEFNPSYIHEITQSYHSEFSLAVSELAKVLDEEILVPLVLPDEKYEKIKSAVNAAVQAASIADHKIELIRTMVHGIAESLYGGSKGLRGY
jgi:hypothetical protein